MYDTPEPNAHFIKYHENSAKYILVVPVKIVENHQKESIGFKSIKIGFILLHCEKTKNCKSQCSVDQSMALTLVYMCHNSTWPSLCALCSVGLGF